MRALETLAGLLLVATIMFDVFRSVVVPRATGRTLRLGPLVGDALLYLALRAARRLTPARRHELLAAIGPLILVIQAATWFFLLVSGFALAMHAAARGFAPPLGLLDAGYAAASSFFTLGVTGHDVQGVWSRAMVVGAALCGFAVVPLVVTFLLNVQSALTVREQLVLRLGERDRQLPTAMGILLRHERFGPGRDDALAKFFDDWDDWSAHVLLTHRAFPILAYFRSTDQECDWLAALSAVLDAAALLAVFEDGPVAEYATLCHRLGSRLARELASVFRCAVRDEAGLTQGSLDTLRRHLARGVAGRCGPEPLLALNRMRDRHEPAIAALCRHFGVQRGAQHAGYTDMLWG